MKKNECREISVEQARALWLEKDVCFVDIRTAEAFAEARISGPFGLTIKMLKIS